VSFGFFSVFFLVVLVSCCCFFVYTFGFSLENHFFPICSTSPTGYEKVSLRQALSFVLRGFLRQQSLAIGDVPFIAPDIFF